MSFGFGVKRHFFKQRILLKIALKIWRSHVNFFKFDYKILSEIGTVASENVYFSGGFSDARTCVELKNFNET